MYAEQIISMIDGPKLREQRQVILSITNNLCVSSMFSNEELLALEGLTNLLDEIADCCHDIYGKDCLFSDLELERLPEESKP